MTSLAKLLSVLLQIKWVWGRILLQSLKLQISCLFWARSSLTFSNYRVWILRRVCDIMITCSPEGDEAKNQYERFLLNIVVQDGEKFLKFGMKKDRINVFRAKYFNGSDSNKLVWSVMLFSFPRCHMVTWPISGLDFFQY